MTTILLLPGMDGTGELFRFLIPHLPAGLRTQIVRYPTDSTLGYDEIIELVLAQIPRDDPVIILGESFSGPIAIATAARTSPLALVLVCSFARSPWPALRPLRSLVRWLPWPRRIAPPLTSMLLGREPDPAARAALAVALAAVDPAVLKHRVSQLLGVDARAALACVRCPVLDLRATHDRVVPARSTNEVARIATHAHAVSLEGPHLLLQAQPERSARALGDFLHSIGTA